MTKLKSNLTTITEQTKDWQGEMTFIEKYFDHFWREINLIVNKELRESNNSLHESVEPSLKAFDMSLNSLQSAHKKIMDIFVKATTQKFNEVRLFDRFEIEDESLKIIFF